MNNPDSLQDIDEKKRVVVVLGMHRSGTSAITRGLQVLGVELGDNLMQAIPDINEKGFWEDKDIISLNIEIFDAIGYDCLTNIPITNAELTSDILSPFRLYAVELLESKIKNITVLGIKDPRICRLLPFWKVIFNELKLEVSYIIVVRNPLSVAQSLKRRDGFKAEKSYYLWLEHILPSILETEGSPRLVVDYDLLMDQPETQLYRIADRINLSLGVEFSSKFEDFSKNFLDKNLRHTRFQIGDLQLDPKVPKGVIESYSVVQKLARDELSIDSLVVRDSFLQLTKHLQEISPALCYMTALERYVKNLNQTVAERDKQIESFLTSTSWKLTQPLRLLKAIIQRIIK